MRETECQLGVALWGPGQWRFMKTPNTKLQTPEKPQASSSNKAPPPLELGLGFWGFFGVWSLVFGISTLQPFNAERLHGVTASRSSFRSCVIKTPCSLYGLSMKWVAVEITP